MNKFITIGVAGIAAYGLFNVLRMKNVSDEMKVKAGGIKVHKVDFGGLTLKADAVISNPTKDSMNLTKPVITLTSAGSHIASSRPEDKNYQLKPLGETKIDGIELNLSWTALLPYISNLLTKIPSLINVIKGSQSSIGKVLDIPLEMTVSTYADNIFIKSQPIILS